MIPTCFQIYFNPIYLYIKRCYELASDNHYLLTISSITISAIAEGLRYFFNFNFFGVPNLILLWVIVTVLIDAYYGVRKSKKKSKEFLEESKIYPEGSPEHKKFIKKHELTKFNPQKLQFTFFKCLTLLGYLFFAKNILAVEDAGNILAAVLGFTTAIVIKAPIVIFWYYDFKSIGDNSAYVYNKKAPIFIIIEKIFEPKINNFFKN